MSFVPPISATAEQADVRADFEAAARKLQAARGNNVQEAAEGFEAVFLTQFVSSMFEGIDTNGLFGGGQAEKMWQGFLTQHIAEAFAERGGIGIADMVMQQINHSSEGFNE